MRLEEAARLRIRELESQGLLREPWVLRGPQGPFVRMEDGRKVLCFCSNNYLGLAADPRLGDALRRSTRRSGVGATSSRLVTGTMQAHRSAERALAAFLEADRALLFSSGYAANVGILSALAGAEDVIFSDERNHASLIDGARLSRAQVHVFRHADLEELASLLEAHRARRRLALVVTEAVFSMDGDCAPLEALRALCDRYDAALVVDEAHAIGVLGPAGRGLAAREGVDVEVTIGTLGKAFGLAGAFVAGREPVVKLLENRARSFVYSTAPLVGLAAAAVVATELVRRADDARARLARHATRLRQALSDLGLAVPDGTTPIVPWVVGDARRTMACSRWLLEQGILVQGIRPPTVPEGTSRLRLVPMATHSDAQLDQLIDALAKAAQGTIGQ